MFGSEPDLKIHVQNLERPPNNWGPKTIFDVFRRPCKLMSTLTANIFGMKCDVDKWGTALETAKGPLHELWLTNGFK